jgi:hypothetical protein
LSLFPTGKPHISFSELFAWKECPYRHKLLHIDKLGSFEPSPFLGFGTGVHASCEDYIETKIAIGMRIKKLSMSMSKLMVGASTIQGGKLGSRWPLIFSTMYPDF